MNAKKLSKRIIASVVAAMLVLTCFVLPSVMVKAAEPTIVNIHYLRDDGSYGEWDVWAWADGLDGAGYAFTDNGDVNGAVTTITITQATPRLGFIIRHPDWSAKDPDPDRFVDLSSVVSGTVEVYCKTGEEAFETDYSGSVMGLKLREAAVQDKTTVALKYTMAVTEDDAIMPSEFSIQSASGYEVAIGSYEQVSDTSAVLHLGEELDYAKEYTITFRGSTMALALPDYFSSAEFEAAYTYTGDDLGVTIADGSTSFRVWAPTAEKVELNLYAEGNGGEAEQVTEMTPDVNGTWILTANGNLTGKYYTYTAYFDGKVNKDIVDPYARTVGVNGQRGMILDLDTTDPSGWESDTRHTYANVTDMEIYELHVRDFSIAANSGISEASKGKYLAFTETGTTTEDGIATGIDHLKDLGVTSVHLLPVYDYGSVDETKLDKAQFNWGYDPVNYNAPEGSYSTDPYHGEVRVAEFKQMVQALHEAGIGVIMDVVYNHTYNTSYCFNQLVPGYFYRPGQNTSGCGNDVASERSMVSKFIVDSVKYWADEYHLDGFRFDLMGILDVDTMNGVRAAVDTVDPQIIIYGEGWNMNSKPTKSGVKMANYTNASETPGIAYFSDTIRDAIKGSVFEATEPGYINGDASLYKSILSAVQYTKKWSPSPTQIINYADCHDNLTLWDKIRSTNPDDSEADQIRMNNLAAAIVQTAQGVPFMMSGEEFLRTKTKADGTFEHNSYASPDAINELDYSRVGTYADVYNYYKGLIALRKAHPAFRMSASADVESNFHEALDNVQKGVVAYTIDGGANGETAEQIMVVYNGLTEDTEVTLPEGDWDIYVNDTAAGNTVLGTATGTVVVPRISAMVLIKGYEAPAQAATYGIIGSMTDWTTDIPMTPTDIGYEGSFTVEPGTYEFKVRANGTWDDSWGVYEEDFDRTYNSQTNVKVKVDSKTRFTVCLNTYTSDDKEDWFITFMYSGVDSDGPDTMFVDTGKDGNYTPPADEPSQPSDEPSKEEPSKEEPSQSEPSQTQPSQTQPSQAPQQSTISQPTENVKTGDGANMMVVFMAVMIAGAALTAVVLTKKSKKAE